MQASDFRAGDIVKCGDSYYVKVHGAIGDVLIVGYGSSSINSAKEGVSCCASHPSNYANWEIVERDGKPYVKEAWKPEYGERYWVPYISGDDSQLVTQIVWYDDGYDTARLKRGLVFKTEAEAIAKAKRMLEVK